MRGWENLTAEQVQQLWKKQAATKTTRLSKKSELEEKVALYLRHAGHPEPVREFYFARPRRWRADFGWPDRKVLLECEGGTFVKGRHSTGTGMRADAEKYNAAVLAGFKVFRVTTDMVRDGSAFDLIERFLRQEM